MSKISMYSNQACLPVPMPDRVSHYSSSCTLQVEWIQLGHTQMRRCTSRMAVLILIGVYMAPALSVLILISLGSLRWKVYSIGIHAFLLS